MNAYVHPDNQRLLWTTVHSVPMIANLPNEFKTQWFKEIVKMFYEKNPHITDKAVLQQINKQTVQYMIQSAKSLVQKDAPIRTQQHPPTTNESAIGITSEFTRYETDSKKNTEWYNKAFTERQKEYEIMHAKPLAPEVNFAIKMDDAPLNNMDELIEKYRKERENDMNPFPASTPNTVIKPATTPNPINTAIAANLQSSAMSASLYDEIQEMKREIHELRREIEELKSKGNAIVSAVAETTP